MFLHTNWEAANGRVLSVDLASPARTGWKTIVPEGRFAIQDAAIAGDRLYVRYLENVLPKVRIFDAQGKAEGEISFPAIGSVGNVSGEWGKSEAFFAYQSFVVPTTIYRYDTQDRRPFGLREDAGSLRQRPLRDGAGAVPLEGRDRDPDVPRAP